MAKIIMDDGFNPEFVETAFFSGNLEIPQLKQPEELIIPKGMIPFSKRKYSVDHSEFVVFYEHDSCFADIYRNPEKIEHEIALFPGLVSPDNSVYVDSPLAVQIANVYRSRAIGYYYQQRGHYIIPNVRWGDERSYTTAVLPERFAFLGLPKHSIYSVGTYGCCKTAEERYHLRNGLLAMIDELEPEIILIYGAMPKQVFQGITDRTRFIQYTDWTSCKKGGARYGNR